MYPATPLVKSRVCESVMCSAPPVFSSYSLSANDYRTLPTKQLLAESAKIVQQSVEGKKLRGRLLKKIALLPCYPRDGGLLYLGKSTVPLPSLAHLTALSDEDLLVYGRYLESMFKSDLEVPSTLGEDEQIEEVSIACVSVFTKYKKVANRIRPVPATLPDKFRIVRRYPPNPLQDLPSLPLHPPVFHPTTKFTLERKEQMDINKTKFLWPEEEKLALWVMVAQQDAIAWVPEERGSFDEKYFDPIVIPAIEHVPWAEKNMPIPPGNYDRIITILKEKISLGVYEPSNSSYRSKWFCVNKKGGIDLRIVHDLQPLNAVTIRDSGVIPFVDMHTEMLGGRACYSAFDLFVAYDQRKLATESRDLTTFYTPMGTLRLTSLPMGATNSVAILQGDVCFILSDEIPEVAAPFMDDVTVKGPKGRYETNTEGFYLPSPMGWLPEDPQTEEVICRQGDADETYYEVLEENEGIRRFVWEHLNNVNRVLHRVKKFGATFSGKKLDICAATVIAVGHEVGYDGRQPEKTKIDKVMNWSPCSTVTEVRGFLGVCGVVRIWVKDFAKKARPLVQLTKKDAVWEWGLAQTEAMEELKEAVRVAPCLRPLDYRAEDCPVVLAVDSSYVGVGWVLLQNGQDKKRYLNRFGSINWNEREARYSQSKLEVYGMWRAMRAMRLYIVGVRRLIVEVDAKYIKGMLSGPDVQPNAAVNRWITGIKLFQFELVHVPAERHRGPDGMSRREWMEGDEQEDEGEEAAEDWIDSLMTFSVEVLNAKPWSSRQMQIPSTKIELWFPSPGVSSRELKHNTVAVFLGKFIGEEDEIGPGDERLNDTLRRDMELPPQPKKIEQQEGRLAIATEFLKHPHKFRSLSRRELQIMKSYTSRFFLLSGSLMRRDFGGRHKVVPSKDRRFRIIEECHRQVGHKGSFTTHKNLQDRFWWPGSLDDVCWFCQTCHVCQTRSTDKVHIPPVVAEIPTLFRRVYVDTMMMPAANKFKCIVQARCGLTSWPEWRPLRKENQQTLGDFLFEEILCRWGGIEEIITDNGSAFVAAADYLAERYGIRHIRISPYNKQANGTVETKHFDVREAIMKSCGNDESQWYKVAHLVFWAERITIRRSVGYSPYFMAHGVEAIMPLDLKEATYLVPIVEAPLTTVELISLRVRQLQKRPEDLEAMRERIRHYRDENRQAFIKKHARSIKEYEFQCGDLVLVRNSRVEMELNRKTKPRYLGPMIFLRRTRGGACIIAEMDGAVSNIPIAAFRCVPYHARSLSARELAKTVGVGALKKMLQIRDNDENDEEDP